MEKEKIANYLIAFGSNLGDSRAIYQSAVDAIRPLATGKVYESRLYKTQPLGDRKQPDYYNAVWLLQSRLQPAAMLSQLQAIEQAHGRVRNASEHYAPRTLDLDLLLCDDRIIHNESMVLPHPRMHLRRFVLEPACDVAPGWMHPQMRVNLLTLLKACEDALRVEPLSFEDEA